jgi:chemotaxis protein MotB
MSHSYDSHSSDEDTGHRGGAWKVAYADFVTALMALFIVLWLVNSARDVREAVSGYFRDPHGQKQGIGSGRAGSGESLTVNQTSVNQLRQKLEQAMRDLPGFQKFSQYVQFTVTGEGLRIELQEKEDGMFFQAGSFRPTPNGERLFQLLAGQLAALPNSIAIEGHTDARPFRTNDPDAYGNWELSIDRANMARRIMLANGLKAGQISEIRGYADRQMLLPAEPSNSRNRRVSVIMKYDEH